MLFRSPEKRMTDLRPGAASVAVRPDATQLVVGYEGGKISVHDARGQVQATKDLGSQTFPRVHHRVDDDFVILNAGLKSEGVVSIKQFKDKDGALEVQVGDTVAVSLDSFEEGDGESLFSREKAKRQEAWRTLSKSYENNETVIGLISGKVKGGFTVEIGSVRAFLPGSLVDVRPVRDPSYLEGKELEFKVIKMD